MICRNCGSEIMDDSKFCINCGAKVEDMVEVSEEPVVEPEASVDETLETAKEAYEQAASDLSDAADQAVGGETSSSFYESNETYSDYSDDSEETAGSIGFAIASLVCGILSLFCCSVFCLSWIFSIAAIVLGVITITKKFEGRGLAIAGIATGGVGILLSIIVLIAIASQGLLEGIM